MMTRQPCSAPRNSSSRGFCVGVSGYGNSEDIGKREPQHIVYRCSVILVESPPHENEV